MSTRARLRLRAAVTLVVALGTVVSSQAIGSPPAGAFVCSILPSLCPPAATQPTTTTAPSTTAPSTTTTVAPSSSWPVAIAEPATHESYDRVNNDHVRIVVEISTTADWSVVRFPGMKLMDNRTLGGSPGIDVQNFTLAMPTGPLGTSRSARLDLLAVVPKSLSPAAVITKGGGQTSTSLRIHRVAPDGSRTLIVDATNDVNSSDLNPMTVQIDRATLTATPVNVGPTDPERLAIMMVHPWWNGTEAIWFGPADPVGPWSWWSYADAAAQVAAIGDLGVDVIAYSFGWPDDLAPGGDRMVNNLVNATVADGRMRLMPYIELGAARQQTEVMADQIDMAWSYVQANPDSFVWRNGKVVMLFFADWDLTPMQWNSVMSQAAQRGIPIHANIHSRADDRAADGVHAYQLAAADNTQIFTEQRLQVAYARTRRILRPEQGPPRVSAAFVGPGYNDTYVRAGTPTYRDREAGYRYDVSWAAALHAAPDWVFLSTWNEWWEQSHIAPDTISGDTAYNQTAAWIAAFHNG